VTASGSDVRAILAELDLRLRELEEELATVGAAPPPQPGATAAPAPDAPDEPPASPVPVGAPAPAADAAAAALEAIRDAVPNAVEVVARAPDALVLRVDLAGDRGPAGAERPGGEDFEAGR